MTEHVDVLIVGAGLSGIGAAGQPQARTARQDLRDPRVARRGRRHLGSLPLPRRPLRLRHVHARLLVPPLDGRARRSPTATRSATTSPTPSPTRGCGPASVSNHRVVGAAWSSDDRAVDRHRGSHPGDGEYATATTRRRDRHLHLLVPVGLLGLLPLRRGLHARRSPGSEIVRGPRSCTPSTGPPTSTTPASASWSSAAAPPRSRSCRRWRRPPSTSRCCSARPPTSRRCRRATTSPTGCAGGCPTRLAYGLVRAKNIGYSMFTYQLSRRRPETMKAILRKSAVAKLPAGLRRRHAPRAHLRAVGSAPLRDPGRRPLPGDHARATPTS